MAVGREVLGLSDVTQSHSRSRGRLGHDFDDHLIGAAGYLLQNRTQQ